MGHLNFGTKQAMECKPANTLCSLHLRFGWIVKELSDVRHQLAHRYPSAKLKMVRNDSLNSPSSILMQYMVFRRVLHFSCFCLSGQIVPMRDGGKVSKLHKTPKPCHVPWRYPAQLRSQWYFIRISLFENRTETPWWPQGWPSALGQRARSEVGCPIYTSMERCCNRYSVVMHLGICEQSQGDWHAGRKLWDSIIYQVDDIVRIALGMFCRSSCCLSKKTHDSHNFCKSKQLQGHATHRWTSKGTFAVKPQAFGSTCTDKPPKRSLTPAVGIVLIYSIA